MMGGLSLDLRYQRCQGECQWCARMGAPPHLARLSHCVWTRLFFFFFLPAKAKSPRLFTIACAPTMPVLQGRLFFSRTNGRLGLAQEES